MVKLWEQAIELYLKNGSMKHTAAMLEISPALVRRYLVIAGVYSTPRIEVINELYNKGYTIAQIATTLNLHRNTVLSMIPYQRGTRKAPPSPNALRIRRCRERKKKKVDSASDV